MQIPNQRVILSETKFCECNIVQRVKPPAFMNAGGIYDEILCNFLNAKLLFLFAYKKSTLLGVADYGMLDLFAFLGFKTSTHIVCANNVGARHILPLWWQTNEFS